MAETFEQAQIEQNRARELDLMRRMSQAEEEESENAQQYYQDQTPAVEDESTIQDSPRQNVSANVIAAKARSAAVKAARRALVRVIAGVVGSTVGPYILILLGVVILAAYAHSLGLTGAVREFGAGIFELLF